MNWSQASRTADLRMIETWDVASVTNLIIYAETLKGANIAVRHDKSERNVLCQVMRLNTIAPFKCWREMKDVGKLSR